MSIDNDQKKKALDAALLQIEKQYGKGAVMKLGDPSVQMNIETIPTGSLSLDIALGLGGIPKGRIIEIYGPESSGKTTVTLHMIAEAYVDTRVSHDVQAALCCLAHDVNVPRVVEVHALIVGVELDAEESAFFDEIQRAAHVPAVGVDSARVKYHVFSVKLG